MPLPTPDDSFNLGNWWIWVTGALGAITRICLLKGNGQPLNLWQMAATLISGTVCAGFGAASVTQWFPELGSISLGISAFVAGIFGMVFAEYVVTLRFPTREVKP
jgi:hypothetical protein